jgi:hypothetical protein
MVLTEENKMHWMAAINGTSASSSFNFTPGMCQLNPYNSKPFTKWFLAAKVFNLTPNWPQNFNFLVILSLISINQLDKNKIWSFKISIFSIKFKLGSQT